MIDLNALEDAAAVLPDVGAVAVRLGLTPAQFSEAVENDSAVHERFIAGYLRHVQALMERAREGKAVNLSKSPLTSRDRVKVQEAVANAPKQAPAPKRKPGPKPRMKVSL